MAEPSPSAHPSRLLTLPPELRLHIYDFVIAPCTDAVRMLANGHVYSYPCGPTAKAQLIDLLGTCTLLRKEVKPLSIPYKASERCTLLVHSYDIHKLESSTEDLGHILECDYLRRIKYITLQIWIAKRDLEPDSDEAGFGPVKMLTQLVGAGSKHPIRWAAVYVRSLTRAKDTSAESVVRQLLDLCCQPGAEIKLCWRKTKKVSAVLRHELVTALGGVAA